MIHRNLPYRFLRGQPLKYLKLWKIIIASTKISKNGKSLEIYEMNRINFELRLKI